uniref:Uncharacterized protein n=1 Tax=Tanacetum cinerariifolium TaxID=118510 RepID=A0A6L2L2Q4_TANCI|nr:hypothetical protein [Tanacetum cinerariifolium]
MNPEQHQASPGRSPNEAATPCTKFDLNPSDLWPFPLTSGITLDCQVTSVTKDEKDAPETSTACVDKPKEDRSSAPLIPDWDTNSDNDSVFRPEHIPPKIDFVKAGESIKHVKPVKSVKPVKPVKPVKTATQKLGLGFGFAKKACFVSGSMSHLIKDRMAKKSMLPSNVGKVSAAKPKVAASTSAAKPINTAGPKQRGHTPGSDEGSRTLKKLMSLCTTLLQKVLDLYNVKTAQEKKINSLKKRITKLEQRQSLRFSSFHPFKAGSSKRHGLGRRKDTNTEMIVEDKGNGEKRGSIAATFSTVRPDISAARPEVSTAEPKTPPTTNLFNDEDVTIVDTLVKMKNQKANEKGIAFKDADDSARPIKFITTLQPLPTNDPKDKDLNEEARTERERQEEASKAALAKMYDEVQAQIDANHELAIRLTLEEKDKYTVKERSKLLAEFFGRRKKQLVKERAEAIRSKPPTKTQLRNLMMTYLKHTDSDKEQRKCLKVVPGDDKAIDYETLDVKSLIVDCESQVLGTNKEGDVHVYKLTRLNGSYRYFLTLFRMLEVFDRQDVLDLHKIIMERFPANDPEDPSTIMNMALVLMAKAFKLNHSTPTNNNRRISSNLRNRQISLPDMNIRQIQMIGNHGRNQVGQYAGKIARNQNGYNAIYNADNQVVQNGVQNCRV